MKSAFLAVLLCVCGGWAHSAEPRFLVVVLDGLRPDYVTEALMPNLRALANSGVEFENHHAVFPTVTRVNSASLSTGSYPETHGLMGNHVYFPEVDPDQALNTSDYRNLMRINEATGGNLLTATTLGEVLEENGLKMLALSSGSTGSAMLMNHTLAGEGVINVGVILPESNTARVHAAIGPAPEDSVPAYARNAWVVDAYIKIALNDTQPDVTYMWLTDPDHTAHEHGIGHPTTNDAIRGVDRELGRILAAHTERDLTDSVNIMVTSDHGFSTHIGGFNIMKLLREKGLDDGVVVAGGAIHLKNGSEEQVRMMVLALQQDDWSGPIFRTEQDRRFNGPPDSSYIPSLSFDTIRWEHDRSADILVAPMWDDGSNEQGYRGRTTSNGVAGHGSTSPYDMHNTLIAVGPAFKEKHQTEAPTSNSDIAPTILNLLKIPPPESMTGRAIDEALLGHSDFDRRQLNEKKTTASFHEYESVLEAVGYRGHYYFNHAAAER